MAPPPQDPTPRCETTIAAVLCAALASGRSTLIPPTDAPAVAALLAELNRLGVRVERLGPRVVVTGCGGHVRLGDADIRLSAPPLTAAALLALLSAGHGQYALIGASISTLAAAVAPLRDAGARLADDPAAAEPTIRLEARGLRGCTTTLADAAFAAALLPPLAGAMGDVMIRLPAGGENQSVADTLAVMEAFGVTALRAGDRLIIPGPAVYSARLADLTAGLPFGPTIG